jgi:hypothetical protein
LANLKSIIGWAKDLLINIPVCRMGSGLRTLGRFLISSWMGERRFRCVVSSIVGLSLFLFGGIESAAEKEIVLGTVEDVILLPWKVKLPARIDTGAAKSSLDAREIKIQGDIVEFRLPEKYGSLRIRLPVVEWRHLRTKEGLKRRPVVELELCIGPKRLQTKVALDDRAGLKYPLLVGRNTLSRTFIVNVRKRRLAPPLCEAP